MSYSNEVPGLTTFSAALASFSIALLPLGEALPELEDAASVGAYLCRNNDHWFALRRFGAHWVNLNHAMQRPAQLSAGLLGVCLRQLEDDGHEIFVVAGDLPPCKADDDPVFMSHFEWGLTGGLFVSSENYSSDGDSYDREEDPDDIEGALGGPSRQLIEDDEYERLLAESANEAYENDIQAAIAASLDDSASAGPSSSTTPARSRAGRFSAGAPLVIRDADALPTSSQSGTASEHAAERMPPDVDMGESVSHGDTSERADTKWNRDHAHRSIGIDRDIDRSSKPHTVKQLIDDHADLNTEVQSPQRETPSPSVIKAAGRVLSAPMQTSPMTSVLGEVDDDADVAALSKSQNVPLESDARLQNAKQRDSTGAR